jgi:PAS fold
VPLASVDRLHVNVGRDFQTCMAQQFLYDLGILAVRVQQRPKSVTECVIRDLFRHLGTLQSRLVVISPQCSGPIGLSAFHVRRGEYPIAWTCVRRKVSPCPKQLGRLRIQRNVFQRSFRFRRTFHHRHYRSTDVKDEVFEIHVLPAKPDQFSSAQPGESVQPDHRAERIGQFLEKCHDLFRRVSGTVPFENEQRALGKDGKYRWCLIRYNPLLDEGGKVIRWYATGTDIDDRNRAEDGMRNETVALREEIVRSSMFEEIVGSSEALRKVLMQVSRVAPTDSTALF